MKKKNEEILKECSLMMYFHLEFELKEWEKEPPFIEIIDVMDQHRNILETLAICLHSQRKKTEGNCCFPNCGKCRSATQTRFFHLHFNCSLQVKLLSIVCKTVKKFELQVMEETLMDICRVCLLCLLLQSIIYILKFPTLRTITLQEASFIKYT